MPVYPVTYAGLRLTSTLWRSGQEDTYNKDASETVRGATTVASDAELVTIPLVASAEYEVFMGLNLTGGSGGIGIKTQWTYTGTWNDPIRRVDGPTSANTVVPSGTMLIQHATYRAASNCTYGLSTSSSFTTVWEESKKVVTTTAGNMALAWGPNTAGATSGGVMLDSWVTVRRIA